MKPTITFNVEDTPQVDGRTLVALVTAILTNYVLRFGKTRATVRTVMSDFLSFVNKAVKIENDKRKAEVPPRAAISQYEGIKALANQSEDGLRLTAGMDMIYAFGRRVANTVGFKHQLTEAAIKETLAVIATEYVSHPDNEYVSLKDLMAAEVEHEPDNASEPEAPQPPAGASEIPAALLAGNAKSNSKEQAKA